MLARCLWWNVPKGRVITNTILALRGYARQKVSRRATRDTPQRQRLKGDLRGRCGVMGYGGRRPPSSPKIGRLVALHGHRARACPPHFWRPRAALHRHQSWICFMGGPGGGWTTTPPPGEFQEPRYIYLRVSWTVRNRTTAKIGLFPRKTRPAHLDRAGGVYNSTVGIRPPTI